ncbi:hypothetical protein Plec18170_000158 [Paecilomyces lecythidis]
MSRDYSPIEMLAQQWSLDLPKVLLISVLPIVAISFVLYCVIDSYAAGLGHIPGPFFARFTDLDGLYRKWSVSLHGDWLTPLHHKYGDIVRVGPRSVSVADPAAIRTIYNTKSRLEKSRRWEVFSPAGINQPYGSMRDMAEHGMHRRQVAGAYATSSLHRYEPMVDRNIENLLEGLEKQRKSGIWKVDIARWAYYYAYDLIGFVTFGKPIGFLNQGRDVHYLITTQIAMLYYFRTIVQLPMLRWFGINNPLLSYINRKFAFFKYAEGQVNHRFKEEGNWVDHSERNDMLSYFLAAREKQPDLMTREEVTTNCFVNMAAGSLSQSKVLEEILRFLVRVPEAQERLYAEIKSCDAGGAISNRRAQALPYLNGVVREGLRLHHSGFGMIIGRDTPVGGLILPNGVHLPEGIEVGMDPRVLGTREETYHDKPYEFRPQRWLPFEGETKESHASRVSNMDQVDLSFGYGASACIGKHVALMSIHKLLANLVYKYKLVPTDQTGSDDDYSVFCTLQPRLVA